jgi:hypothetical protein
MSCHISQWCMYCLESYSTEGNTWTLVPCLKIPEVCSLNLHRNTTGTKIVLHCLKMLVGMQVFLDNTRFQQTEDAVKCLSTGNAFTVERTKDIYMMTNRNVMLPTWLFMWQLFPTGQPYMQVTFTAPST